MPKESKLFGAFWLEDPVQSWNGTSYYAAGEVWFNSRTTFLSVNVIKIPYTHMKRVTKYGILKLSNVVMHKHEGYCVYIWLSLLNINNFFNILDKFGHFILIDCKQN